MHFACLVTKATNTPSQYVIIITFPRQEWLRENTSVLRYTYIASLSCCKLFLLRLLCSLYIKFETLFYVEAPLALCPYFIKGYRLISSHILYIALCVCACVPFSLFLARLTTKYLCRYFLNISNNMAFFVTCEVVLTLVTFITHSATLYPDTGRSSNERQYERF